MRRLTVLACVLLVFVSSMIPTLRANPYFHSWACEQTGVIEGECGQLESQWFQGWGGYQAISLADDYGWFHTASLNWECSGWVKLYMGVDSGGVQAQLMWTDGEGSYDIVAYAQAWSELGFPDPAHSHQMGGCWTTSLGLSYQ